MAKIRSFKDFAAKPHDGEMCYDKLPFTGFDGIHINLDLQSIGKKGVRRICRCGNVDDGSADACEACGNNNFQYMTLRDSRWYKSDSRLYDQQPLVRDDTIVARYIDISWDSYNNRFVLKEEFEPILRYETTHYSLNTSNVNSKLFNDVFMEYVKDRPEWAKALELYARYPARDGEDNTYRNDLNNVFRIVYYNNMYIQLPNIDIVTEEEFRVIYTRFIGSRVNKIFSSIEEFYTENKIPSSLSTIYSIVGLPTSDLSKLDQFDPCIIRAISYALLHKQVSYHELETMFRYIDAENVNAYGIDFAEFFRKNVVKYGDDTWEAFLYVAETPGATGIKDANLRKFVNYSIKKGIKRDKAYAFADLIDKGNGIEALKALVS